MMMIIPSWDQHREGGNEWEAVEGTTKNRKGNENVGLTVISWFSTEFSLYNFAVCAHKLRILNYTKAFANENSVEN